MMLISLTNSSVAEEAVLPLADIDSPLVEFKQVWQPPHHLGGYRQELATEVLALECGPIARGVKPAMFVNNKLVSSI